MRKLKITELNRLSQEDFKEAEKTPLVVVLDNVRSLHNVGSVFRTSDAFLVEKIYLCGITACPPNAEIHKTALGAENTVEWIYYEDTCEALKSLKSEGYRLLAIEQAEGSILLNDFTPNKQEKYAIVFGNEVKGISQDAMDICDDCIEIPQFGTKHSLNVSVTSGIVIWDFFRIITLCLICLFNSGLKAQDVELNDVEKLQKRIDALENAVKTLQKFKVSGCIQAQYQYAGPAADGINFKLAKGINSYENNAFYPGSTDYKGLNSFGRLGIRRGNFKLTYEDGIVSGVVQIDATDKGIGDSNLSGQGRNVVMLRDIFLNVKDPWFGTSAFKAGITERPFGHEIAYPSTLRESPERSRVTQALFPEELDLGAMLTLRPAKTSPWNFLKLEAGLFSGNGIKPQIDNHLDFIGHLSAIKALSNSMSLSGGISLYMGGVLQQDSSTYVMKNKRFVLESKSRNNIGKLAMRQYIGFDVQFSMKTEAGLTQLRSEYIFGQHPGNASGAYNFQLVDLQSGPVFMRKIAGGYVVLVQDLGKTPFSAVIKYDWYDPNTGVSGNDIASPDVIINTTDQPTVATNGYKSDIAMSNIGLGLLWNINSALRLTAYQEIVRNETTKNSPNSTISDTDNRITKYGWESNRPDNVFTLRLQYKF